MNRLTMLTKTLAFLCLILFGMAWGQARADNQRVLIVHSSPSGYAWVQDINAAIKARFDQSGIDYRFFYLDTFSNSHASSQQKVCSLAKRAVETFKPQVVIAVDDDAQEFFVKPFVGNSPIQFVFCGVNAEPEAYGYPADNVTGILERTYPAQTMQLLKMIAPQINSVVCISDDSYTSNLVLHRIKSRAADGSFPVRIVDFTQPSTFSKWISAVGFYELKPDIDAFLIPFTESVKQGGKRENMSPFEIMMWTMDNVTKPIVGLWPTAIDHGALCAVVVDPKEHGTVAALMAKKILAGKKAGDIPIVTNQDGYVIVNLKTASKLNIDVPFSVLQSADQIIE